MKLRSHLDIYIWPLALVCSILIGIPLWNHHAVHEIRAGFPNQPAAEAWARSEMVAQKCVAGVSTHIFDASQGGLDLTDGHPVTITLRCHHKNIWWQLAAVAIGPLLFMMILVRMIGPAKEKEHYHSHHG